MLIILVLTIVDSMDPLRSKCVRGPRWRGFVLIAQLLLSQMPEFIFPTFGSAGFLPKLIRSCLDFFFARFGHYVSPIGAQPHPPGWGLSSGDLQSMETGLPDSSPRGPSGSSLRCTDRYHPGVPTKPSQPVACLQIRSSVNTPRQGVPPLPNKPAG